MAQFNEFGALPDVGGATNEERFKKIQDHLFRLQEQLTYLFQNLGMENINATALDEMKRYMVEDLEGNVTELELTAEGINSRVESAEGNIGELELTAEGLSSRVGNAEGAASEALQTANGFSNRISDTEGAISEVLQTVNGLSLRVRDADGNTSYVDLSTGVLNLKNLVFNVLGTSGGTTINGDNITTGTLYGITLISEGDYDDRVVIENGRIEVLKDGVTTVGMLGYLSPGVFTVSSAAGSEFTISGSGILKIMSQGNMSINAATGKSIYIGTETGSTQTINIGNSNSTIKIQGKVTVNGTEI